MYRSASPTMEESVAPTRRGDDADGAGGMVRK
jgi:hypothetical protein